MRNIEIDVLRGIAIIMMIIYHFLFDLNYFFNSNINISSGFWKIFQIITAGTFLFLVGIGLSLTKNNFKINLLRGLKVLCYGLIITLITYILFPERFIFFGILHLIGVSIITCYQFRNYFYLNLLLGIVVILLLNFNSHILILFPLEINSLDYFPVIPWISFVFIGMFFGNLFRTKLSKRSFLLKGNKFNLILEFLGKNSLLIYLLHQIVLFVLFNIFRFILKG